MSTEHRESDLIRSWLDESYEAERDPHEYLDHLLDEVPDTPQQRRRRWPFPLFRRQAHTPTATPKNTAEYQPSPIPATNGHTPTVIGRTRSMLSPVNAIIAGALVFGIGGVMLVAQPFDEQGITAPSAEGDAVSMDPAWVTGTILHAPSCIQPKRTVDGDVVHEVGYRCESQLWEADDARLNGRATPSWNADVYRLGPDASVSTGIYEVETETGGWLCSSGPTVAQGSGLFASTRPETIRCAGQDTYVGLTAVLDVDPDAGTFEGLVFSGAVPEAPAAGGQ
jgi:hypothetical protein